MKQVSELLTMAWEAASAEVADIPGYYRRRLSLDIPFPVYAGIAVPNRVRRVSIEFGIEALQGLDLTDRTRGYLVETERDRQKGTVFVHVEETLASLPKDLFRILCEDLLERIIFCKSSDESARILQRRLQHWKNFFLKRSGDWLSYEECVGLFGEIEFLERCLTCRIPPMLVVNGWQGPLGSNQDFLFGKTAIEVKTVTANDADVFRVSNLRQVDDTGLDFLGLCHIAYDFREGSGRNLASLITSVRSLLRGSPDALTVFDDRLLAAGYVEPDFSPYAAYGFTERRRSYYRVLDGFPRILESDLSPGIHDVGYSVNLAACAGFGIEESELLNILLIR